MARYVRYKRYYKKVYPRKRWASNIKSDRQYITINTGTNTGYKSFIICKNSHSDVTPTPTILRFARFRMKGDVRTMATNAALVASANAYVVFVPEGVTTDPDLLKKHPEYILGWTTISMNTGNAFSLTSPLKRNLNSGDTIQVIFTIDTSVNPTSDANFDFYYTVQFWTTTS